VVCSCVARPAPTSTLSPYTTLFRSNRNSIRVYPAIPVEFQSLIGRAQTGELLHHVNGGFPGFQSLIGRAQTADGTPSSRLVTSRSEEHTSELQSRENLVCRLLLEKE